MVYLVADEDVVFGEVHAAAAGFKTDTQISNTELDFAERDKRLERWTSEEPMQGMSIEEDIRKGGKSLHTV